MDLWVDGAIKLAILLGSLGVIWKVAVAAHKRFLMFVQAFKDLAFLAEQWKPNGGTSPYDTLKRIDKNVILQRKLLFAFHEDNDHGLLVTDSEGKVVYSNRTLLEWHGYSADEALENGWINIIDPSDREAVVAEWQQAVEQGRDSQQYFDILTKGGERILVEAMSRVMKDADGILGWVSTIKKVKV